MTCTHFFHGRFPGGLLRGLLIGFFLAASAAGADKSPTASRPPWTKSRLVGSPDAPAPYRLALAFPKLRFDRPTSIEELPDANRLLVTEMGGKVFTFNKQPEAAEKELVIDLRELLPKELAAKGVSLFDAALHPKFRENRYLFLCYVHPAGQTRVSRFTLTTDSPPAALPDSEQVVIIWPSGGHNAGCLEFGVDNCLYIATGDGSGPNPPDGLTTGQDISDLLGSILRIDVDHPADKQAYAIPKDNPFVKQPGVCPEIWAYGLRNPWKFGIDPQSGDIFAADNGWESWEMVHRVVRGGNCGWPVMEGRAALRSEVRPGPTPILPPVKDHPHTEANSVIGGPVYQGEKLPQLAGCFIYGDYITGTIWAVRHEKDDSYSHSTLVDTDQRIVAFTQGRQGELFVLDYDFTGQIYELLQSTEKDTSANFPRRLSETGLFASLDTLDPAPGVIPYSVQVERWLDGAQAQRFVAIPGAQRIQLANSAASAKEAKDGRDEPAVYPAGTVLVKHLSLPLGAGQKPLPLETQLLHYEQGTWRPYSYLWDDAGKDATLVESIGKNRTLRVPDKRAQDGWAERTWHVNAVNECKLCHNAESRFLLGFTSNQLNFLIGKTDQASSLVAQGVLRQRPEMAVDHPLRLVDPYDASQNLNDRARSYLHANCGMCHQPGGNAIVGFFLRRDLPFDKLNTNRGTGIGTFGIRDAKIIAPGDPFRSLLLYRMSKLGYARMPYIGSQLVDGAGVALIEEWIRSLPPQGGAASGPATEASAEAKALQSLLKADAGAELHDQAIRELVKSTEGSLALIAQMHRGTLTANDLQAATNLGAASSTSNIRGLFDTFLPESRRRATLGANIDPKTILDRPGDSQRGKLIFFSDGARCRACHDIDDRNVSLGPTLREIKKKYPLPAELLQHVIKPSLKIEEPFAVYIVRTSDGQTHTGLIVENTPQQVVLKTTERKLVRLARDNIEELRKSDKSLMPEGVLADLTAQEAADLFEFIRVLEAAK